jgi:hypothetical protein
MMSLRYVELRVLMKNDVHRGLLCVSSMCVCEGDYVYPHTADDTCVLT